MSSTFRHAVASFEPTSEGVLLWTRLSGNATEAAWAIAADASFADVVAEGTATTDATLDHTVVVEVGGLEPATTYWYRFEVEGERSPVGRTRTLPAPGATDGVRLGLVSCARYSVAPLGVYRAMAEREVDLVVHLGDYVYEDDGHKGPRAHRPPRTCVTLADYRQRLAQIREDPDCQALHLRHPMMAVLDDHDVADNCWTNGAKTHDPEEHGPWDARVEAATTARQEWVPARLRDPELPSQTWRSVAIGDLAELVLLDTRLSGRDQQAGDRESKDLHDPARSLLGEEQRAWVRARAADVTRPWMVLVTGVVVNPVDLPLPAAGFLNALLPNGYQAVDGKVLHDDQWDGYPREREGLVSALADRGARGGRTVVLSADIHSSWAFEGPRAGDGTPVAVEFTTPSVASKPMGHSRTPGAWRMLDALVRSLEHVPFCDVTERGYGILDLTPTDASMSWWFVEATSRDPSTDAQLGASYRTRRAAWPPRLEALDSPRPDPVRPGLPEPLPPRPADLTRLRRGHVARELVSRCTGVFVPAMALAALGRRMLTRRR